MPDPLPFNVTAEAEEWLAQVPVPSDAQPGITFSARYAVFDGEGNLTEKFFGEHYGVRHAPAEAWMINHAVQAVVGARTYWVPPSTLDKLRGKTLTLIQAEVSSDLDDPRVRTFLVAA